MGLASDGITVEIANRLQRIPRQESIVLAPASEILPLQQTHAMAAGVAVVADGNGAIAMRTPSARTRSRRHRCGFSIRGGIAELLASDAETLLRHRTDQLGARRRLTEAARARSSSSRELRRCASRRPASARI